MSLNIACPDEAKADLVQFSDTELEEAIERLTGMRTRLTSLIDAVRQEQDRRLGQDKLPF